MQILTSPGIDKYAQEKTTDHDELMVSLMKETHEKMDLPQMLTGPVEGCLLNFDKFILESCSQFPLILGGGQPPALFGRIWPTRGGGVGLPTDTQPVLPNAITAPGVARCAAKTAASPRAAAAATGGGG